MTEPRLMREEVARAYLGGVQPRSVMPPLKLGGRCVWDRRALEARLNSISGLEPERAEGSKSPLEAWEAENGDNET